MNKVIVIFGIFSCFSAVASPQECIKIESRFKKVISDLNHGKAVMDEIVNINSEMESTIKKYPECKTSLLSYAKDAVTAIDNYIKKDKELSTHSYNDSELVTYEEWFTMHKTSIKSGKKYKFSACVNGSRNATSIKCNTPGSAAKRIFFNTDDIKDLETKKKWVNTINEVMCVTAYVTGGEAYVSDLSSRDDCKK